MLLVLMLILGIAKSEISRIPKFIEPCSKSAADFQKCCTDHGNKALPLLLQGDKELKIPKLNPYHLDKVVADAGPNLKITLTNIELQGVDSLKVTDMNVDFDKKTVYISLHAERVMLIGTYAIDGKILVLPIKGNGPLNITIVDSQFKYSFSYKLENRAGVDYAIVQDNDSLDFKISKSYYKLDNLFNGNKAMGDNVNKFLNENDQDIIKELSATIKAVITSIARTTGGGVLSTIPFSELFLP
ncbi:unnamed protein product [Ceutorhynchus assimilis]|uniref:Uncharacterized protein n=1 Tax=Ceutorhynchus assimilis TaxID=467358 RepID=A0A9P0DI01_9CUCU|nr:unnamed protein product [Ceutorhynchus assimilis]